MAVKLSTEYARNVRSDLADGIERYWVGHKTSHTGLQYLDLKDGRVVKGRYLIERTDIFCFQDFGRVNVFVEADGSWHADVWTDGDKLTDAERRSIDRQVKAALKAQSEYVEHEGRFLRERPWEDVYGMTPEDAVESLREWERRVREDLDPIAIAQVLSADKTQVLAEIPIHTTDLDRKYSREHIGGQIADAAKITQRR